MNIPLIFISTLIFSLTSLSYWLINLPVPTKIITTSSLPILEIPPTPPEPLSVNSLYQIGFKYDGDYSPPLLSNEEFLELAQKASQFWDKTCGIQFNFKGFIDSSFIPRGYLSNDNNIIIRWEYLPKDRIAESNLGNGLHPNNNALLLLDITFFNTYVIKKKQLLSVLIHELGHSIGLDHSNHPQSVMHPHYFTTTPNPEDTKQCNHIKKQWATNNISRNFLR